MANHTRYYTLKKQFYKEHPRVEKRTWEEIDRFLNLHQIKFSGFDFPKPVWSLDEINFPEYVASELRLQGVSRPSAVQSMAWPSIYSGRDIMCIGLPTVSRVLSYICPAVVFVREQPIEVRKAGPLVLIVTQTKEVAKEIFTHAQMFIHQSRCSYSCLFDDENINSQSALLREHEPDILIGNYHRLCELMDNELVNLKNVSFLVMDDFYRNRSARLSDEIKRVVNETRSDRQTIIFSRIVPSGLQKSNGDEFQSDAVFVSVGNDDVHVYNRDMPQTIHVCTMAEKRKKLQDIITEITQQEKNFKILVYANGFKKIRITEKIIKELKIDTFAYERTQAGRKRRTMKEKVYYNFNATPNSILIASDVISSKVELPELTYIINADFPVTLSLYLNRMRMSNIRRYISIFIAEDARHAERLIYVLNECRQPVPPILFKISEAYVNSGKDVDRMPSLQEINDGLTKPVEKPIPKPLPPTVSSDVSTAVMAAKSALAGTVVQQQPQLQQQLQQSQPDYESNSYDETARATDTISQANLTSPPPPQPPPPPPPTQTTPLAVVVTDQASTQLSPALSSSSSTSSSSSSSSTNIDVSTSSMSISSSSASSLCNSNKRSPPPPSPSTSTTTTTTTTTTSSSQSPYVNNNNRSSSSSPYDYGGPNKRPKTFHHRSPLTTYRPRYPPMNVYSGNPIYTSSTYYAAVQTPNYLYPPPMPPPPSGSLPPQHNFYAIPPPPLPPSPSPSPSSLQSPQQYYVPVHHHHPQQHHPALASTIISQQISAAATAVTIKVEPQQQQENPYFTNPIPFKQEPTEPTTSTSSTSSSTTATEAAAAATGTSSSSSVDDDAVAMNIVSHLLKDQQILNRLEKVAQSFRLNS